MENIQELSKTKEGRLEIFYNIIKQDNLSITDIIRIKEHALNNTLKENNELIYGLAFRSTCMFGIKSKDVLESIKLVKPLVAKDILKSGVVKGTPFEKELLEKYSD